MKLVRKNYTRDIFKNGHYAASFRPDSARNPFKHIYDQKRRKVIKLIEQFDNSTNILDIGSGMARIASTLSASNRRTFICADISFDMLKMGRDRCRRNNSLGFIQTDAHWLPFEDHSFNCILALDLLCHLEKPIIALQEFYRVLEDDGNLIIDSTNSAPLWAFFYPRYLGLNPIKWFKIFRLKGVLPGWEGIVKHYTQSQFSDYLSQTNFHIDRIFVFGPRICPKWHLALAKKTVTNKS